MQWADGGHGGGKRGGGLKRHFKNDARQMDEKLHEGLADRHGPFQHVTWRTGMPFTELESTERTTDSERRNETLYIGKRL